EDLTIEGSERFRFSLGDGPKHKSTHKRDEDCVKVDEDKRDLSIIIPLLGQLRSFGKLRFPSESADYY
ncbi:unnamed protein product, partial [Brassica rapa]